MHLYSTKVQPQLAPCKETPTIDRHYISMDTTCRYLGTHKRGQPLRMSRQRIAFTEASKRGVWQGVMIGSRFVGLSFSSNGVETLA